ARKRRVPGAAAAMAAASAKLVGVWYRMSSPRRWAGVLSSPVATDFAAPGAPPQSQSATHAVLGRPKTPRKRQRAAAERTGFHLTASAPAVQRLSDCRTVNP